MNATRTTSTSWPKLWTRAHKEHISYLPTALNEYEEFVKKLDFTNLRVVVDVGAGSGLSSVPLARSKCYVVLADISASALHLARELYKEMGLRGFADLVLADAFHLPFRDKSADLALSWGLLEHFKPEDSVRIVKEKLRIGKMIMEIVPYRRCIGYSIAKRLAKLLNRRWPYGDEVERDYEELEILREVVVAGYNVKCLKRFGRSFGVGFLISVIASDPLSYRKALSKHPLLERAAFALCKLMSMLAKSHDNLVVVGA